MYIYMLTCIYVYIYIYYVYILSIYTHILVSVGTNLEGPSSCGDGNSAFQQLFSSQLVLGLILLISFPCGL